MASLKNRRSKQFSDPKNICGQLLYLCIKSAGANARARRITRTNGSTRKFGKHSLTGFKTRSRIANLVGEAATQLLLSSFLRTINYLGKNDKLHARAWEDWCLLVSLIHKAYLRGCSVGEIEESFREAANKSGIELV